MSNTILLKKSGTPNAVPAAGNLALGELAINYADGNLFYKDGSNQVKVIASNQFVSVDGNVTGGNVLTTGVVSAQGNVTGNYILGNGAFLTGVITSVANINNGTTNVSIDTSGGNVTVGVGGTGNVAVFATSGLYVTGITSSTGNVVAGNLTTGGQVSASGDISGNNLYGQGAVSVAGNATSGNVNTSGLISAGANITGGNLLTTGSVSASSNITAGNVLTGGEVSATGNIAGSYILGNGAFLTGLAAGTANSALALINGTTNLTTATNGNANLTIGGTSNVIVWDATGQYVTGLLSTTGNVLVGSDISATGNIYSSYDIISNADISAVGTITGGNLLTGGIVSATGNGTFGNLSTAGSGGNISGANVISGTTITATANVTGGNINTGGLLSTNNFSIAGSVIGNLIPSLDQTYNLGAPGKAWKDLYLSGNSLILGDQTITSNAGGISISNTASAGNLVSTGAISASGNIAGGNLITGGLISATSTITGSSVLATVVSASGNITGANVNTGALSLSGNVISNINTVNNITTTANITGGNVLAGLVSASGNIVGANVNTGTLSLSGNVISNINTVNNITTTANVTGGNVLASLVSASGNVDGGNVNAGTAVFTPNVTNTGAITISSGSNGNINLQPNGTGNIVLANTYINSLAEPVQDYDAATKLYVDTVATTGFAFHQPVYAATTGTLATATGGTISYNQPNGAGNGVGATLTTTGSFYLIDTANVQTVGTRILVKNEANAAFNGVYTYANTTVIVRAIDADQYGADSSQALSINDYFFVQAGNVNIGSAYVVSAPAGTITFGTSNIEFSQFSSSQVYTANTNAGLSLIGTVFNAKVDGVTTAFDGGGNIVVKASAQLTTPNIGDATGTSLSVTGTVSAGNINADSGYITTTGNITSGNVLTGGLISATSTITSSANITGGNVLTGGLLSATSTITSGANITGANLLTGGLISATGNITGSNVKATNSVIVDGGAYGNVTTTQFASVFASGAGPNPYSIMQVRSSDGVSGLGMQAFTGSGILYGNTAITFALATIRDKDVPSNLTTKAYIDSTGLLVTGIVSASGNVTSGNVLTGGLISATGNITGANILTSGLISVGGNITTTANITGGNVLFGSGIVSGTGNIYGGNIFQASNQVLDTTSTIDGGTY